MESSNIPGWVALAFAALSAGTLVYTRFRTDFEDLHDQVLTEMMATLGLAVTLGPLPRLWHIESAGLKWTFTAVDFILLIVLIIQIRRLVKLGPRQVEEIPTTALDK